jgi:uncharacterized protein (DUF1778 family)
MTADEVKGWLAEIDKDRLWLADLLRSSKGTVDQWFSKRGFPEWAIQIIRLKQAAMGSDAALQLRFNPPEWQLIQRAMARAGYTNHFDFMRDAILAFAQEINSRQGVVPLSTLSVQEQPSNYESKAAGA